MLLSDEATAGAGRPADFDWFEHAEWPFRDDPFGTSSMRTRGGIAVALTLAWLLASVPSAARPQPAQASRLLHPLFGLTKITNRCS